MKSTRRHFLGSSAVLLGTRLLEVLGTPLRKWARPLVLDAAPLPAQEGTSPVTYVDVAQQAGVTATNVWGGVEHKNYIIEAKGSGLAFYDFDQDGWLDIFLTNGQRLEETYAPGTAPTAHLYKNNRDGTFTDVTAQSGLGVSGWLTGVCVGDYDNDGWTISLSIAGVIPCSSATTGMGPSRM